MTSPAGGNDDVVRYVFQAVADYGQLLRETRQAREETRALKADIDGLAGTTTHRVKVTADTGQARTELARVFQDVAVKIKVTVDAAAANAELQRLLRDVTIKAKLVVDAVAARAEIARATRDATVRVRLHPDTTDFIAVLGGLLRDRAVQIAVALDEHGVTERFRALLAHLESMGPVTIRVDLHEGILDRIEAAADRLRRLRDDVQGGGGGPGPDPDPDPGPRPGGGSGSGSGPIPPGLSSAASMVAGWGSLIAAAVPVAAALAGGIGTIAAAFAAAGGAAGIFAVAAVGELNRVTEAVKAYEKSGSLAEGPLGTVVTQFETLKARYNALLKDTERPVFAVFNHGLQIAMDLLDRVEPLIGTVATAIDGALGQIQDAVNGPVFGDFLNFVSEQGPHALGQFTAGLLGFGAGLTQLIMAFGPFIRAFVDGFAHAGQAFQQWAAGLGTNPEFQRFLAYAMAQIPHVIDLIINLVRAAVNVGVALAPIGEVLLSIANAALKLIAALPPGVLLVILGAILGLAGGIKALQAAIAINQAWQKFTEMISGLPGRFGAAVRGLGAFRAALMALGAATLVGAALAGIVLLLSKLKQANDDAADAAKTHTDAVRNLGQQLAETGGVITDNIRKTQLDALANTDIEGEAAGTKIKTNVVAIAGMAGIGQKTLADAATGNQHAAGLASGGLEVYARQQEEAARTGVDAQGRTLDKTEQYEALARADAARKAGEQVAAMSPKLDQARQYAEEYNDALGGATDGTGKLADALTDTATAAEQAGPKLATAAEAADAVKKALQADFSSDVNTARYDAATQASEAYKQGLQAQKDAIDQVAQAERNAKAATDAVNEARLAAVQRIKDVQRALRDQPLDERQAKLNAKQADQSLAKLLASGGTTDQIEQARIDDERAHNALNDLQQDKGPKKTALNKELAAGVEGNKPLQAAIQQQKDAAKALAGANRSLAEASSKVNDLHAAFLTAIGGMGITEKKWDTFHAKVEKAKQTTIKIALDTKGAEAQLAKLLQGRYALQLMAKHPDWTLDRAMAEAAKALPTTAKPDEPIRVRKPGGTMVFAEGGPTLASATTAGAVVGPGHGTSDNIAVRLPVGGDALVSPGEHIVTDAEVRSAPGGHGYLEAFRAGLRAGRPWAPPTQRGYAAGGAAAPPVRAGWVPAFGMPTLALAAALPGYAAGGAVAAATAGGTVINRSVSISGVTITNAVPETASTSLYRMVRRAVDGEVA